MQGKEKHVKRPHQYAINKSPEGGKFYRTNCPISSTNTLQEKRRGSPRTRETWKTHWLNSMCRHCLDTNLSKPTIPISYKIEKFEHWLCVIINIKELLWRSLYMIIVLCTYNLRAFYLLEIPTEIFIDSDMVSVTYLEGIPPVSGGVVRHSWSKRGRRLVFVEAE